ncbi:bifunctional DNA primase/polymerase [Mycolicibacterium septicum]|uniref:bifunctional DNA primase/polymerase n=1 Tax=Mycolicibacterium septicum TaxID=98668 RepID=UPI001AF1B786|nr:bifunctional DNA primase/polymerase [Mycolicibacterium septicum]QRY51808.1 bifunctional DNA primase/polymerase [Mycolicibacterium septicum]
MFTYTQCSTCKGELLTSYVGQETCVDCPDSPTEKQARDFVDAVQRGDEAEIERTGKLLNQPTLPPLGSAALWYATVAHWAVFPVVPGDKRPMTKNGLKDATTDPEQVQAWWQRWPEANIGGVTGRQFSVLDIDGPQGFESLRQLDPGIFPEIHGKANTPRGQHWYMKSTGDGNRAGIRPGLDFRGIGGYVLLPVSRIGFKQYSWAVKPSPAILGEMSNA